MITHDRYPLGRLESYQVAVRKIVALLNKNNERASFTVTYNEPGCHGGILSISIELKCHFVKFYKCEFLRSTSSSGQFEKLIQNLSFHELRAKIHTH